MASAISIDELARRPSRPPDYTAENQALVALAQQMAASPGDILQKLAETALSLCRAHSAGLSLLEDEDQRRRFHWRAIAGRWAPHLGGGTPRDFGPCGTVLDRNESLLFSHPERDFPYFGEVSPLLEEALLIPFHVNREAVGTIWVVLHDTSRRFDAEDLRVMTNLGTFAAAAYQTVQSIGVASRANERLLQSVFASERLAAIVESSDDAIVSKDLDGIIATWNAGAERLFGYTTEEAIGKPITIVIPPDRHAEEPEILARLRRGDRIDHFDTVRRRKDGSLVEISLTISPIKDQDGRIIGASKIAQDITERRQAQQRQSLLLREMNHRTKNLFALASGLVTLSTRSARTPDKLATSVRGRLTALANAHDLTLPELKDGAQAAGRETTLHALLRTVVSPYVGSEGAKDERLVVDGPDVAIDGNAVTGMALVLHELATNAAKFGALSAPEGRIEVDCVMAVDELRLSWRERGGPRLDGPAHNGGFGSLLARNVVEGQFGGKISRDWEAEGLIVRLMLPAAQLAG